MRIPATILSFVLSANAVFAQPAALPKADAVFPVSGLDQIELGRLLFYDPVLSGNRSVSCATCHHPRFATTDGLSLGLGDGGIGLGPARRVDPANTPEQRVPRNSMALFNLGASGFTTLFHDGRLEADPGRPAGIRTPLGEDMVAGFQSVLAAQTMFPAISGDEMAGHYSENDVSRAVRVGLISGADGAWQIIADRVSQIAEYRSRFDTVIGKDTPVRFTDISNALAAFIAFEWRADDSPFDRFLRGEADLPAAARRGMTLFYGAAGCSACHSGQFQTDLQFHAIAMPQIGPGKAARFETHSRDTGRMRVTGDAKDAYKFRTPSLRNVTRTAPYGHAGSYATLKAVIRHHLDPVTALLQYDRSQALLPELEGARDWAIIDSEAETNAIAAANELDPVALSEAGIDDILAFLESLEDQTSLAGRLGVPATVPSGLPVDQ